MAPKLVHEIDTWLCQLMGRGVTYASLLVPNSDPRHIASSYQSAFLSPTISLLHLQVLVFTNLTSPLQLLNPSLPVHLDSRNSYPFHLTTMIVFYPHLTPLVCLVLITNAPRLTLIKLMSSQLVFLAPASHPPPPLHPKIHLPLDAPVANAILPFTCKTLLHS